MNTNPLDTIQKTDRELFETISRTRDLALEEGALSKKNKLLIAVALDAAQGSVNGVRSLTLQAMEQGASQAEVMEALRVANYICGAGSIYTAANALRDVF